MRVRFFWRDHTYRDKPKGAPPIDAFWVEATQQEVEASVFPFLKPEQIARSHQLAAQCCNIAASMGVPARAFCFLVARDLSSVEPFPSHYPVHQMWNAYSPFESTPDISVNALDALRSVVLPPVVTVSAGDTAEAGRGANTRHT